MIDKRQFIGKYCDVETRDGKWRLGVIEGSKGNREDKDILEVALDGWSSNKNQKVCIHSSRIQPPRYFSRGYTGQPSTPLRNINFDMAQISYIVNWLKLFHNFDFKNMPILEITNLFRCQMFILVDSILFHPWYLSDGIEDDLRKVESLFHNIVQISVLYLEKLSKYVSDISKVIYERHFYLQSFPISYLEASYELFLSLKNIFGFSKRSEKFYSEYQEHFNTNFVNEFIDLGCINLLNRFMKEFVNNKLFEDKFYLIANILDLNVKLITRSHHHKLSKSNQFKYINEILNFIYREHFVELINKNEDDPDVIDMVDSFVEFAKANKNFVSESQKFGNFIRGIKQEEAVFSKNVSKSPSMKSFKKPQARYFSDTKLKLTALDTLKNLANPIKRPSQVSNNPETVNQNTFVPGLDLMNKLQEIESKLNKIEDKFTPLQPLVHNSNIQKSDTTEFNIITPIKEKSKKFESLINDTNLSKLNVSESLFNHHKDSYAAHSDPYDEMAVLDFITSNLDRNNYDLIRKIVEWRKKILQVSKNNGWVVGKLLAGQTIRKLEISDSDIITANLMFMEQFNLVDRNKYSLDNPNFYSGIDYRNLLREYENKLISSFHE